MSNKKDILEYNAKFSMIPKDYMERLAYLYNVMPYKKKDMEMLINSIDRLKNVNWDSVTYIFYMVPRPSHRPRLNPKTFTFYVRDAKNTKDVFDKFKEEHSNMECVISTPCTIHTKCYIETPKGMNLREVMAAELELIHHVNAPDYDNLAKTYTDMVQKTLISNDSIIFSGTSEKFYSILPRIEITIRYMTAYDCKYNKRSVENRKSFKENPLTMKDIDYII